MNGRLWRRFTNENFIPFLHKIFIILIKANSVIYILYAFIKHILE